MDEEDTQEAVGSRNDERLKMFEAIADKADKERAEDFVDIEDEPVRKSPYKLALDEEGDVVGEKKEEKPGTLEKVDDKKYRLKVNGREKEVTEQELIALAQKVEAADEYLRQAKEAAERFDRMQINPPASAVAEPSKPDVQEPDDVALARALQMGTEEEAAQVIKRLRTSIQPDEVIQKAAAEALNRMTFQSAFDNFKKEYKEIADDPNLMTLAIAKDQQLIQSGDRRPYAERFKSIGEDLRKWRGITPSFAEKEERKSATVTPIRTASARAVQPPDDEQEESPSEIIAKMARARGQ